MAVIVVAGMLDALRGPNGRHRFIVKGGSALELRFGSAARASKDFDTVFRGELEEAAAMVTAAVGTPWSGFTGRVVDVEKVTVPGMPTRPVRFKVKLAYQKSAFATLPVEVSAPEGASVDGHDTVAVTPLTPVGLPAPETVSCLSMRYQIAQKLHACTDPLDGVHPNDRARDLADLIRIDELAGSGIDFAETRAACVEIFSLRDRQPWVPALVVYAHWPALWSRIVDEDGFPVDDVEDAAARVRSLIARIDAAG